MKDMIGRIGRWALGLALIVMLIALGVFGAEGWTPYEAGGVDIAEPAASISGDVNAKRAVAQRRIYGRNKSGSAFAVGDPVVIDGTSIEIVASAAAADDMTIAESLSSEGGLHYLMVAYDEDQADTLTGTITGTDLNGVAQTETVTTAATGRCLKSAKLWKTITDIDLANLQGNVQVYAYSVNGVTDASADGTNVIGFAAAIIADNAEGEIAASHGGVMEATCIGPSIIPGDVLSAAGSGKLDEDSTAPIAISLEPTIDKTGEAIRVLIMRAND